MTAPARESAPEWTDNDPLLVEQWLESRRKPQRARFEAAHPGTSWFGIIKHDRGYVTPLKKDKYEVLDYEVLDAVYDHPVSIDEVRRVDSAKVVSGEPMDAVTDGPLSFALLPNYPNPFTSEDHPALLPRRSVRRAAESVQRPGPGRCESSLRSIFFEGEHEGRLARRGRRRASGRQRLLCVTAGDTRDVLLPGQDDVHALWLCPRWQPRRRTARQ